MSDLDQQLEEMMDNLREVPVLLRYPLLLALGVKVVDEIKTTKAQYESQVIDFNKKIATFFGGTEATKEGEVLYEDKEK